MDGKKFPPMLPRMLRVTRAKNAKNLAPNSRRPTDRRSQKPPRSGSKHEMSPKEGSQASTGRAKKMLGRADGAKLDRGSGARQNSSRKPTSSSN